MMFRKYGLWIAVTCIIAGALVAFFGTTTRLTVTVDGIPKTVLTHAFTVGGALGSAHIPFHVEDRATPHLTSLLPRSGAVRLDSARPIHILIQPGNVWFHTFSAEPLPGNILLAAGIRLYPGDRIYLNGAQISPSAPLPLASDYTLQVRLAQPITLARNDQTVTFYSSGFTILQAFAQAGLQMNPRDQFSQPVDAPLLGPTHLVFDPAPLIQISYRDQLYTGRSNAATVGQALAESGIALQDLDYTLPAEDQPLPADGNIRVVAVRDAVKVTQVARPFATEYTTDESVPLDTTKVMVAGVNGLEVSRQHVFSEDGAAKNTITEPSVVLSLPTNAVIARGTRVVVQYLDTPSGTIQYYRSITVHATSYKVCNPGASIDAHCMHTTASSTSTHGGMIAVNPAWLRLLRFEKVYIPGYGIASIEDTGGGYHTWRYWVDLAYIERDFIYWDSDVTVYFLYPPGVTPPLSLP